MIVKEIDFHKYRINKTLSEYPFVMGDIVIKDKKYDKTIYTRGERELTKEEKLTLPDYMKHKRVTEKELPLNSLGIVKGIKDTERTYIYFENGIKAIMYNEELSLIKRKMGKLKIDKKEIGNFKAKFKSYFDRTKGNDIFLEIEITQSLKQLLKKAIVKEEETTISLSYLNNRNLKRYKVLTPIFNSLNRSRDLLFLKPLLSRGKIKLSFNSVEELDRIIKQLKENIKLFVQLLLKFNDFETEVTFNVKIN